MEKHALIAATLGLSLTLPAAAQEADERPTPNSVIEAAAPEEWAAIPASDLMVMRLADDAEGNRREVVIQLVPKPFSQGWVDNIRLLAGGGWYDDISINRVQDNYVVQWGDVNYDNPEAVGEAKQLPNGLKVMTEDEYTTSDLFTREIADTNRMAWQTLGYHFLKNAMNAADADLTPPAGFEKALESNNVSDLPEVELPDLSDRYAAMTSHLLGWPIASGGEDELQRFWLPHCYGMVGVGRNYSPDTGSGAELYTVIGHAPRHLDRNIALVGRVIEGMEHLTSLPRGNGELGFYADIEIDKRTPILTVRVASDLSKAEQPKFEYLSTESESFAAYAKSRANRRDPFFITPAGGADICNIPVPIRRTGEDE